MHRCRITLSGVSEVGAKREAPDGSVEPEALLFLYEADNPQFHIRLVERNRWCTHLWNFNYFRTDIIIRLG